MNKFYGLFCTDKLFEFIFQFIQTEGTTQEKRSEKEQRRGYLTAETWTLVLDRTGTFTPQLLLGVGRTSRCEQKSECYVSRPNLLLMAK